MPVAGVGRGADDVVDLGCPAGADAGVAEFAVRDPVELPSPRRPPPGAVPLGVLPAIGGCLLPGHGLILRRACGAFDEFAAAECVAADDAGGELPALQAD